MILKTLLIALLTLAAALPARASQSAPLVSQQQRQEEVSLQLQQQRQRPEQRRQVDEEEQEEEEGMMSMFMQYFTGRQSQRSAARRRVMPQTALQRKKDEIMRSLEQGETRFASTAAEAKRWAKIYRSHPEMWERLAKREICWEKAGFVKKAAAVVSAAATGFLAALATPFVWCAQQVFMSERGEDQLTWTEQLWDWPASVFDGVLTMGYATERAREQTRTLLQAVTSLSVGILIGAALFTVLMMFTNVPLVILLLIATLLGAVGGVAAGKAVLEFVDGILEALEEFPVLGPLLVGPLGFVLYLLALVAAWHLIQFVAFWVKWLISAATESRKVARRAARAESSPVMAVAAKAEEVVTEQVQAVAETTGLTEPGQPIPAYLYYLILFFASLLGSGSFLLLRGRRNRNRNKRDRDANK